MRRTEQEFKAEVLRRSDAYRRERARKRKKMMSVGICVCLCVAALTVMMPMGGASSDCAAPEAMLTAGGIKTEAAMSQQDGGETNGFPQETYREYCFEEAAPMEQEPEEAVSGTSRCYDVVCIEVRTNPESDEYSRFYTDPEKIVPIIIAIERFYPADGVQEDEQTGLAYEIVVTHENKVERFSLIGDGLYTETDGWIGVDADASRRLKEAISQESDAASNVSVSRGSAANSWPLNSADAETIEELLCGDWILSAANCLCDYTLYVNGETYRYHSDCGTIQDEYG